MFYHDANASRPPEVPKRTIVAASLSGGWMFRAIRHRIGDAPGAFVDELPATGRSYAGRPRASFRQAKSGRQLKSRDGPTRQKQLFEFRRGKRPAEVIALPFVAAHALEAIGRFEVLDTFGDDGEAE